MGFWVATTRKGEGSGCATPSTETWCSSMASSRAAWVLGGVRLISSARTRLAKMGPARKWKEAFLASYTMLPVTSDGMRSGVNWTLRNSIARACPSAFTISVLATPGTPSRMTWPRTSRAARIPKTAGSWPFTALATSALTAANARFGSPMSRPPLRPGSDPGTFDPTAKLLQLPPERDQLLVTGGPGAGEQPAGALGLAAGELGKRRGRGRVRPPIHPGLPFKAGSPQGAE